MSSTAASASSRSTVFDRRTFACAVDKRIIVSKVLAVTGVVCKIMHPLKINLELQN